MTEYDVELTIQKAMEKYPLSNPRLISDNGSQYTSNDFAKFLKEVGLQHIKTSVAYPQSNGKACAEPCFSMERFYRTIGEECLRPKSMVSIEDARKNVSDYIEYYH